MPRPTRAPRAPRSARSGFAAAEAHLRDHALAKPDATEHFPWGERAIKVKGKVFLFMRADAAQLSLSTKLPRSAPVALMLPFATPTGYGLGRAGWVSARFAAGDAPPLDILCSWIDESYQAVAPAKLAALANGGGSQPANPTTLTPAAGRNPSPAVRKPTPARTLELAVGQTPRPAITPPKPRATDRGSTSRLRRRSPGAPDRSRGARTLPGGRV